MKQEFENINLVPMAFFENAAMRKGPGTTGRQFVDADQK
jgi:hypothetical protein